ncbi:hypothetical protein [Listeria rustica]|uniref:Poly A polymerase head domain-containing protein n=1 Tax=Listeria rustica TaxID=2713503 RepID=A0A7W1T5E8_9LIST|nr:hypothetical protein [Listeria rustica]MBA3925671.1 hypothetical protein [Listeria rustica]
MNSLDIGKKLDIVLKKDKSVFDFVSQLSNENELIFFGGAIRDLYMSSEIVVPRDFDIVLNSSIDIDEVESYFYRSGYAYRKNRFDGFKVEIGKTEVDLWYLDNTWAFKNNKVELSVENLTSTVYLNLDGIAYNYNGGRLYNTVFEKAEKNKEIDIVLQENPQEKLNLLRALVFKEKYNYSLSENLIKRYLHFYEKDSKLAEELNNLQIDHYGQAKMLKNNIDDELQTMCL